MVIFHPKDEMEFYWLPNSRFELRVVSGGLSSGNTMCLISNVYWNGFWTTMSVEPVNIERRQGRTGVHQSLLPANAGTDQVTESKLVTSSNQAWS